MFFCFLYPFMDLKVVYIDISMHNLLAIFAKFLDICKEKAENLMDSRGNLCYRGVVSGFIDLKAVALNIASEAMGIEGELLLFVRLQEYGNQLCQIKHAVCLPLLSTFISLPIL